VDFENRLLQKVRVNMRKRPVFAVVFGLTLLAAPSHVFGERGEHGERQITREQRGGGGQAGAGAGGSREGRGEVPSRQAAAPVAKAPDVKPAAAPVAKAPDVKPAAAPVTKAAVLGVEISLQW
jgi:hypothetical protein